MTVIAGVDVGNATTEVAFLDGNRLVGADRVATRGRKGSVDSLRGAAALVRRLERRLGCRVGEARVAPLRAVDTTTLTIPAAPPATGHECKFAVALSPSDLHSQLVSGLRRPGFGHADRPRRA